MNYAPPLPNSTLGSASVKKTLEVGAKSGAVDALGDAGLEGAAAALGSAPFAGPLGAATLLVYPPNVAH
jgi:hypothetical protein